MLFKQSVYKNEGDYSARLLAFQGKVDLSPLNQFGSFFYLTTY